jgi:hypothetical protein
MKKLLSIFLILCMMASLLVLPVSATEFTDMPSQDAWSYNAMTAAVENGLFQGRNGKLLPHETLTRAQLAAVLNRAFGAQAQADVSQFTDIAKTAWYYADIAKAVRMGAFQGGTNGTIRPNDPISRQEAFTVLSRVFHLADVDLAALDAFSDKSDVSAYAKLPLAAMVQAGYVGGARGKLLPRSPMTREQFAQVLYKLLGNYITKPGTVTQDMTGNVMINVPEVTLQNLTITGDLILGDGVGNGAVTLDSVTVTGRLVIRGGGSESIILRNKTSVGSAILCKAGDGGVRLHTEDGCKVETVYIDDGRDDIILDGSFDHVFVQTDAPLVLNNAAVTDLTVSAENASIKSQGTTVVSTAQIAKAATGAVLTVDAGTKVTKVESAAPGVKIAGSGTVTQAVISGSNTAVNVNGAKVTVQAGATGVTQSGSTVTPTASGSGGSSSGGGSTVPPSIVVTSDAQLLTAIKDTRYLDIYVGNESSTAAQSFTIPASAGALTMGSGRSLYVMDNKNGDPTKLTIESGASLTVDTLVVQGYLQNLGTITPTAKLELAGMGILENRGILELTACTVDNSQWGAILNKRDTGTINGKDVASEIGYCLVVDIIESDTTLADTTWTDSTLIPMGVTVNVPDGKTLTFGDSGSDTLIVAGALNVQTDGNLANKGYIRILRGSLNNAGTLNNDSSIENSGVLKNTGTLNATSFSISLGPYGGTFDDLGGTTSIGQINLPVKTEAALRASLSGGTVVEIADDITLTSNLTIDRHMAVGSDYTLTIADGVQVTLAENATINMNERASLTVAGQLDIGAASGGVFMAENASLTIATGGVLNNSKELYAYKGTLNNSGTLTNRGKMLLDGVAFTHGGDGAALANSNVGEIELVGGAFNISTAEAGSLSNAGSMRIVDRYWAVAFQGEHKENATCSVTLDSGKAAFKSGSNKPEYIAEVYSAEDFGKAETTQSGKAATSYVLSVYSQLEFKRSVEFTTDKTLSAFADYWVVNDGERKTTLTVASGTLTVGGTSTLHVLDGALNIAAGATLAINDYRTVEVLIDGGLDNKGTILFDAGNLTVYYEEVVGNDPIEIKHFATIPDILPDRTSEVAIVHTPAGLVSAADDSRYTSIEILGNSDITLKDDLTITKPLYIETGSSLTVPVGKTLTLVGNNSVIHSIKLKNDGEVSVLGALALTNKFEFSNNGSLAIGVAAAVTTTDSYLYNHGSITVNKTGTLTGQYSGIPATGDGNYNEPSNYAD